MKSVGQRQGSGVEVDMWRRSQGFRLKVGSTHLGWSCLFRLLVRPLTLNGCSPCHFGCSVGDYITMGLDFLVGKKNPDFGKIHDFFLSLTPPDSGYSRQGCRVRWADVFLDLPMGCHVPPISCVPAWNELTEEHLRHGVGVVFWPIDRPSLLWVQRHAMRQDLEVYRRASWFI